MNILFTDDIKNKISVLSANTKNSVDIVSAYCKTDALKYINNYIGNSITKRLLIRYRMIDIITGASDFSIYEYCKSNAWTMYINFDLHSKIYIFDETKCVVGSANLTNRGIGISSNKNHESATMIEIDNSDYYKIENIFNNSLRMNDYLYEKMKIQYLSFDEFSSITKCRWSKSIVNLPAV